eukprot:228450-Chlamydomonas_euryale.AAC.14
MHVHSNPIAWSFDATIVLVSAAHCVVDPSSRQVPIFASPNCRKTVSSKQGYARHIPGSIQD